MSYFVHNNDAMDMLSSEDKILSKTCGNLKDFLPDDSSRDVLIKSEMTNIGRLSVKVVHAQSMRSKAPQEDVGHGHPEMQIPLPQMKTQLR